MSDSKKFYDERFQAAKAAVADGDIDKAGDIICHAMTESADALTGLAELAKAGERARDDG
ncbi:hypothetical protein OEIGOIKO_05777 [Streptomyces chrestomyceticus JCM 4735]|uniref:Uncharacterized protein n=1 Tax=Streptomyces chrestomyceticus JCM 4735 TaxID=1306181 RepID=A0A7U9L039_9ACTN|nr:hypothetical protein [Streptomyces chrestomyceticus]GCD37967.1 hypothetical protein OEIGOIKO_05777 [Streptomyces chrestomyceticus JCM 4735]